LLPADYHVRTIQQRFTPNYPAVIGNVLNETSAFLSYDQFFLNLPTEHIQSRELLQFPAGIPDYYSTLVSAWTGRRPATSREAVPLSVIPQFEHLQPWSIPNFPYNATFQYTTDITKIRTLPDYDHLEQERYNVWTNGSFKADSPQHLGCCFPKVSSSLMAFQLLV
jgi:hypothetical protein